jgi:hypothetical protein
MNPLSGVLDEAWRMYKTYARHLLAIAFVIYLIAAVLAALLALLGDFGLLLGALVEVIAAFLLQATLVKAVQDVRDGRADLSIGETVSAALPSLWSVVGASILAGIAITIGLFLLIVPGLYLITIWAVIVPVIVIERSGVFASFGRSHELVRGHAWHVFATLVLVFLIMLVVDIVLGVVFAFLPHFLRGGLSSIISGTLISPYLALVVTLVYYRLVSAMTPTGAGEYGGYQQSPQGGGYGEYGQPSQGGGFPPPPSPQDGGFPPPPSPQDGGFPPPPSPQDGGFPPPPPPQGGGSYGAYQPRHGGGYQPPPQDGEV